MIRRLSGSAHLRSHRDAPARATRGYVVNQHAARRGLVSRYGGEHDRVVATLALRLTESHADGAVRLGLVGELDLASGDQLLMRLQQLLASGARVRIDLSQLQFIDSRGMHALIRVVALGRETGDQRVQIDPELSKNVREIVELTGISRMLWPQTRATPSTTI